MGQHADDILDGLVCEGCGEWMDDVLACDGVFEAQGHPRRCDGCKRSRYKIKPRRETAA
jgi:hypothetical protein